MTPLSALEKVFSRRSDERRDACEMLHTLVALDWQEIESSDFNDRSG